MFITFEGHECSGKTTQAKLLYEYFKRNKCSCLLTSDLNSTSLGVNIKDIMFNNEKLDKNTELLLFNACRNELNERIIKPHLENGTIVICDRYFHSTIAYQGFGYDNECDFSLQDICHMFSVQPDFTFLLHCSYPVFFKRLGDKQIKDKFEKLSEIFHQNVYKGYENLEGQYSYMHKINADQPILEIHKEIIDHLDL